MKGSEIRASAASIAGQAITTPSPALAPLGWSRRSPIRSTPGSRSSRRRSRPAATASNARVRPAVVADCATAARRPPTGGKVPIRQAKGRIPTLGLVGSAARATGLDAGAAPRSGRSSAPCREFWAVPGSCLAGKPPWLYFGFAVPDRTGGQIKESARQEPIRIGPPVSLRPLTPKLKSPFNRSQLDDRNVDQPNA